MTQAQRLLLQVWHPRLVAGYRGLGGTPNQSFQNGNLGLAPSTGCKGSNALRSSSSYWSSVFYWFLILLLINRSMALLVFLPLVYQSIHDRSSIDCSIIGLSIINPWSVSPRLYRSSIGQSIGHQYQWVNQSVIIHGFMSLEGRVGTRLLFRTSAVPRSKARRVTRIRCVQCRDLRTAIIPSPPSMRSQVFYYSSSPQICSIN